MGSSLQSPIPQNTSSSWIFPAVRDWKTSSILCLVQWKSGKEEYKEMGKWGRGGGIEDRPFYCTGRTNPKEVGLELRACLPNATETNGSWNVQNCRTWVRNRNQTSGETILGPCSWRTAVSQKPNPHL
jgi:hypothetical protein